MLVISIALGTSYWLGTMATITGGNPYIFGVYGTAVATMGMLMSAAYILAMDTFGPITDNAGGIVEMSGQPQNVREVTDALDAAGNTTKALTKGYAVGSAALAAFLLFSAYQDKVAEVLTSRGERRSVAARAHVVNLANLDVFIGAVMGTMLVYLFSSLAIRAVGRAAQNDHRRGAPPVQGNPKIMAGTNPPDYARLRGHHARRPCAR